MRLSAAIALVLSIGMAHGAPNKRGDPGATTITDARGSPVLTWTTTGATPINSLASWVQSESSVLASLYGSSALREYEASIILIQAADNIAAASATHLTAIETTVNSAPVVEVSSVGGGQEITLATGTAGAATTFGGLNFTAVPNAAHHPGRVPHGLLAGAAAVMGSVVLGSILVL
ncbi:hypothetical protein C8Q70DRAFT_189077 [Cubamyces menziesii]|uniref:Uncharacterized protein n=1 Tax=Trametes cubensis TaxID=1111947 RepID=A0AAD7TMA8_9APHY|nr:hypothetical protein C8Q70DRAFT_189077 [Cubamyces menziesii]KAJ8463353.1 hypothetical protein ONZ51_g10309 [Trametes cubensis]